MEIRKARMEDLERLMEIYASARERMRESGNPNQWGTEKPSRASIEEDIERGVSHVLVSDGEIRGVFAFLKGVDPTYGLIEGAWLNEEPYGTIHRLASDGSVRGVFRECLNFCEGRAANVRVDTHEDNRIMQHLLEKCGYTKCGIIYLANGEPRWAYHKKSERREVVGEEERR